MRSLKDYFVIGLFVFMLCSPAAVNAETKAHKTVTVPILTLPLGANIYEWWANFERIFAENDPWLRIAVQETPGFIYNIKEMSRNKSRWKTTIFGTENTIQQAAENVIEPFFHKRIDTSVFKYLYPFQGCVSSAWLWVTLDPKIKTMSDFAGKRIGVGLRGQIAWGLRPTEALQALGVHAKLEYMGPLAAIDALLDGRVDAAQIGIIPKVPELGFPARPQATLQKMLASRRKFYYVSYGPEWIERMKKQKGYAVGQALEILPGSLPQQHGKLMGVTAVPNGWAVHESFPEEVAYEFTKFMIVNGSKLSKYTEMGKYFVIPKGILRRNFHFTEKNTDPGAVRAYKEAGVW